MKTSVAFFLFSLSLHGAYSHMRSITVDHTQVGGSDLTNFTVAFSEQKNYFETAALGGTIRNTTTCGTDSVVCPADLIFTSDSGCAIPLNWEIESYTPVSGNIVAWVRVPTISHTTDTVFYICYGNASVTAFQGGLAGSAWDSNTAGVYHFGSTTIRDSSSASASMTNSGNSLSAVPGKLANADLFPGPNQYSGGSARGAGNSGLGSGSITISAWVNFAAFNAIDSYPAMFLAAGAASYPTFVRGFGIDASQQLHMGIYNVATDTVFFGSASSPISSGAWHFVTGTYDGSAIQLYVDSAAPLRDSISVTEQDGPIELNYIPNPTARYNTFSMDELKFSSTARPQNWIAAEYINQNSPQTFYALGTEAGSAPAINASQAIIGGGE